MRLLQVLWATLVLMVAGASAAYGACSSPGGQAGQMVYASTQNVMVYCDGTNWVSMAGGISVTIVGITNNPGGSSGQVQFNSGSGFAGDSNFTYSSGLLTIAGTVSATNVNAQNVSTTSCTGCVPSGAIMAFNSTSCPSGWTEFTAARGRFLRGIDNGAGNDPDGTRTPGATQADAMQGHFHGGIFGAANTGNNWGVTAQTPAVFQDHTANGNSTGPISDGTDGTPRTSTETRPKNVAVLFCVKS